MAVSFSSDGSAAIERQTEIQAGDIERVDENLLEWTFDLNATAKWLIEGRFERVALQFPDRWLPESIEIANFLEKAVGKKPYIMADTSYGSCCVDKVTAAHVNADCVVHYGDACLSQPPLEIPVYFVFPKLPIDLDRFKELLFSPVDETIVPPTFTRVVLLYELAFWHACDGLEEITRRRFPTSEIHSASPILQPFGGCFAPSDSDSPDLLFGRRLPSFLSQERTNASSCEFCTLFVGRATSPLLALWLLQHPRCCHVIQFDPSTQELSSSTLSTTQALRRRLFLVERVRDANSLGLVAASAGVRGQLGALSRLRRLCRLAGKRCFVLAVGKPNVPKLANFAPDVDVFVLLSCPFGALLERTEHARPVVSVFEAVVALEPRRRFWCADAPWTADFNRLFWDSEEGDNGELRVDQSTDDAADVSLVTGRVRAPPPPPPQQDSSIGGEVQLYSIGEHFKQRSWQGLQESFEPTAAALVEEGKSGVAAGYDTEPTVK